ncbi:hypothetical protein GCM10010168_67580 [Actinoplanes ianthinogenes]|uniref:Uncharacterized protein n=1 Tax=Actinoplanes ianthinogenes TaxID=122358 RepID=A0ABM7LXK6_9ACTN|nr:hypothetical protein [Actinoplanes ianthinogenes]BCJ43955.1 hypothetical protein Aiant_46120 [Actinoplanes ianthinogenes]GGR39401.1 hypothetical protein GCM10010168_67580 [Actinoplanes ianthinogenes]
MNSNQTDVVGEYLREVELRLSGLPLLQRRELLADLAAHIETERVERNVRGEAEMIEILERLGSPEVVAAAAYEEAGTPRMAPPAAPPPPFASPMPPPPAVQPRRTGWIFVALAVVGVVIVLCLGSALMLARNDSDQPPAPEQAPPAPTATF